MMTDAQRHALQIVNNAARAALDANNAGWPYTSMHNMVDAAFAVYVNAARLDHEEQRKIRIWLGMLDYHI